MELDVNRPKFTVIDKITWDSLTPGAEIPSANELIQFHEGHVLFKKTWPKKSYDVTPGIYGFYIEDHTCEIRRTEMPVENLLNSTDTITKIKSSIDDFFSNIQIYKDLKFPARRGVFLYGPPGCGKSSTIVKSIQDYINNSAIFFWPAGTIHADSIDSKFKDMNFMPEVKHIILVAEDIGGADEDQKAPVDSDTLALLDNKDNTFVLPTLIIGTTNYPEKFMASITNRPGRFDDKIEIGYPDASTRVQILQHFIPDLNEEARIEFAEKRYNEFSAAHVKEVVLRHKLKRISLTDAMRSMYDEIQLFKKAFTNKKEIGL